MLIRRILVPVDFSDRSRHALQYAFELAELAHAELDVLHVIPGSGNVRASVDAYLGRPMPHVAEAAVTAARQKLQEVADGCARHQIVPHLTVEVGDPASGIVRAAAESAADLIVLGTRGHRGVAELLLGSVAHKVITCSRCPVVTLGDRIPRVTDTGEAT